MSEPSTDPPDAGMLFSPVRREPSSDAPVPADTSMSAADDSDNMTTLPQLDHQNTSCYVSVPELSVFQKAKYQPVAQRDLESDEEFGQEGAERVVGELEVGQKYFYVRYADGVVYRVPARPFEYRFPELVQEYEESQAMGTLPPFNPSSSNVHPSCRQAGLIVKIPCSTSRSRDSGSSLGSGSSHGLGKDEGSEEYSDDDSSPVKRRSTRTAAATANKKLGTSLPFSPKKTRRSTHAIVVHDSDSDSEIQEIPAPIRKSTRARTTLRSNLDDQDFEDNISPDSDADFRPKAEKKKKIVRGKASRPAYGHFRAVIDLQLDEEETEDIAPLIAHRAVCEKCQTAPTHEQAKKKGRKRKPKEDDSEDEETRLANLGGWVRCLKCPVTAHWGCLAKTQRDEILRAAHERDKVEWRKAASSAPEPRRRLGLDTYQTTEFICTSCMRGGICMACKEIAIKPDEHAKRAHSPTTDCAPSALPEDPTASISLRDSVQPDGQNTDDGAPKELLFRCFTCKRLAHYAHMPVPDGFDPDDTTSAELASYYQYSTGWRCADCISYVYTVEHVLAWRPFPENTIEPPRKPDDPPNYKSILPREYLIKWADRSYRRVQWVPHGWLLAVAPTKLKNFLLGGTKVHLLPEPISEQASVPGEDASADFEIGRGDSEGLGGKQLEEASPLIAYPDAERRIPPAWRTVDRLLDIRLWRPKKPVKGKTRKSRTVASDEEEDIEEDPVVAKKRAAAYDQGEEPPSDCIVTLEEFEALTCEKLSEKHAAQVAWAFIKWDDLGYDDASWDSFPRTDEAGYAAYEKAFKRFISARSVTVPARDKKSDVARGGAKWLMQQKFTVDNQPGLGQSAQLKLMPFQVDGVNWLCHNWNKAQNCILADEMGLGKTVQIVTFIGYIVSAFKCFPALVVVPNSTLTNWVREFERWAPKLRVVPFYGEAKAREVIKKFEVFHPRPASGTTGAKYHVLVTTYETITNTKEFGPVFKSAPIWEMLVVDEGQRLKSDASLIFKRLKELNSRHRIIMTGTPLNNNIRELFNLMNFLDPDEWADLEALSKQYEELTDELVADLHGRLKPYFLRRIKSEVLQLPPKNEVIVPVSMAPLQKEIYRSLLSQNFEILRSLTESNVSSSKGNVTKTNMNNLLMQLRKCVQHPYLVSPNIEPKGLSPQETHERLTGASAKLRLLKTMLPKLRARGHRVLLFSQFSIALDIVEDFLIGEGTKYLRLDGSTKQADRQKGMDEFNKKDSDVFLYLLTTRAGGVGINLWSADTVIIFDPDFNPHQDLQAIARAHRYGQKKTVLVFKLMVKDSAEERIMQTGKKKLILDHLIVQKMDDESGSREDVQSILLFGAKALFEETEETVAREVHYSEHDIDNLIEKTEKEGEEVEPESGTGSLFAFAKVWSADKEGMEELADEATEQSEEADSWAKALELIATRAAAEKEKEQTGRGVRRKAAAVFPQQSIDLGDTPIKDKAKEKAKEKAKGKKRRRSKGKSAGSDDSEFQAPVSDAASESDGTEDAVMDVDDIRMLPIPGFGSPPPFAPGTPTKQGHSRHRRADVPHPPLSPIQNRQGSPEPPEEFCGLCGERHAHGRCPMTESPENLAMYRLMLLSHAGDETIEERRAAIRVIDETLHRLGKIHLIYGQPLHLVEAPAQSAVLHPPKKPKLDEPPRPGPQFQVIPSLPRNVSRVNQPVAGPSRLNGTASKAAHPATAAQMSSAVPRASNGVNAVASTSKVPGSAATMNDALRPKKPKVTGGQACTVCGQVPHHLVKDCPVVAQGPSRVSEAIARLAPDPSQGPVVDALKSILKKQQRRALGASATKSDPASAASVIDLTE